MKEQQLQDKLDEYYNRGIQHGIRMMKDKMLLACRKGTPIEIDGRVYYIRSDLDNLKEMGMKLYCLHDLDISGIYILDSFATPNKKFKNIIYMENLGVTIEDIRKYNIEPEKVEIKKEDRSKLENLSYEYQQFFNAGTHYRRVELNAFTTAQILEIIDEKLSRVQNLPTVNLETSLNIDHKAIKETAFMRIMSDKYTDELSKINVPIDLSQYKGRYTLETAKKEIPEIEEDLILLYEQEIEKKLNIS